MQKLLEHSSAAFSKRSTVWETEWGLCFVLTPVSALMAAAGVIQIRAVRTATNAVFMGRVLRPIAMHLGGEPSAIEVGGKGVMS